MATQDPRVVPVLNALRALETLCNRGFALAVHIRLTRPTLLYQTYAAAWTEHYSMKGYMLTDPTVLWGLEHTGRIRWSELAERDTAGVFRDALAFGLTNGCTYAVGPASSRTIASGSKSGADFTEAEIDGFCTQVDAIHEVTEGFDHFPPELQHKLRTLI